MLVKKKIPKNHRLLFTFAFRFILLLILETLSITKSEIEPVKFSQLTRTLILFPNVLPFENERPLSSKKRSRADTANEFDQRRSHRGVISQRQTIFNYGLATVLLQLTCARTQ